MRRFTISIAVVSLAVACRARDASVVIHPDHAGPVRFGMPFTAAVHALDDTTTANAAHQGCTYWRPAAAPRGVSFMIERDAVVRADVDSGDVETPEGIGIGSSEADVQSAYGKHLTIQLHNYQWEAGWRYFLYLPPTDSLHAIVFETDGREVRSYRVGLRPQVQYVERCG